MKLFNALAAVALASSSFAAAPLPNPVDMFQGFTARLSSQSLSPTSGPKGLIGVGFDVSMFSFSADFWLQSTKSVITTSEADSSATEKTRTLSGMAFAVDYGHALADGLKGTIGLYYSVADADLSIVSADREKVKQFGPAIGLTQKLSSKLDLSVKLPMVAVKNYQGQSKSTYEAAAGTSAGDEVYKAFTISNVVIALAYKI